MENQQAGSSIDKEDASGTCISHTPFATWTMQDLQNFIQQTIASTSSMRSTSSQFPFDPSAEVDTPYTRDLKSRLLGPTRTTISGEAGRGQSILSTTGRAQIQDLETAMIAQNSKTLTGKWKVPDELSKLGVDTVDYDWWFRQMYEHLDNCCITGQTDWIRFFRVHSKQGFWHSVRRRLEAEGIEPSQVLQHADKFHEYVALRYTPPNYPDKVMHQLLRLQGQKLDIEKAWSESEKLVFCYNECMRRRHGTLITDRQHSFISSAP